MFSKRIIELADLVPMKSTVVDVGCDHALLDIYLTSNRRCKCTASDINPKCLKSANENIKSVAINSQTFQKVSCTSVIPENNDLLEIRFVIWSNQSSDVHLYVDNITASIQ